MAKISKARLLPTSVLSYLEEVLPDFAALPGVQQRAIVGLMLSAHQPAQFRHSRDTAAVFMTYQERDSRFGSRDEFYSINARLRLFHVDEHWRKSSAQHKGYTKAYYLTEHASSLLMACATMRRATAGMVTADEGSRVKTAAKDGILSRDSDGNHRKGKGQIPAVIEVNRAALEALRECLREQKDGYLDYLGHGIPVPLCADRAVQARLNSFASDLDAMQWLNVALYQLNVVLTRIDLDYLPSSTMEIQYQQYPAGRLFALGLSLQNVVREIRRAALRGLYDFDVSNCHPSIILQLAARCGRSMPALQRYLDNKRDIRERLARDVGISVDAAKQSILSIFYGVRRSSWSEAAIPELMGPERAQVLYQHPDWAGLVDEVRAVRDPIIKSMRRSRGRLINPFGRSMATGTGKARKIDQEFAFVVQGCEAWALNAIIEEFGSDLRLLCHDGWVASRDIPVDEQARVILEKTGFALTIEGTKI